MHGGTVDTGLQSWAGARLPWESRDGALMGHKIPESVLVVLYTLDGFALLLRRVDHPMFWQSVTGSKETLTEPLLETCRREVFEETGLDVSAPGCVLENWQQQHDYEIFSCWRHRYSEGVTHNTEHVFGLRLRTPVPVSLAPGEHLEHAWLPWQQAWARCSSPSNRAAIATLPSRIALSSQV